MSRFPTAFFLLPRSAARPARRIWRGGTTFPPQTLSSGGNVASTLSNELDYRIRCSYPRPHDVKKPDSDSDGRSHYVLRNAMYMPDTSAMAISVHPLVCYLWFLPLDVMRTVDIVFVAFLLYLGVLYLLYLRFRRNVSLVFSRHCFEGPSLATVNDRLRMMSEESREFLFSPGRVANILCRTQHVTLVWGSVGFLSGPGRRGNMWTKKSVYMPSPGQIKSLGWAKIRTSSSSRFKALPSPLFGLIFHYC